jgi:hypothetical protein
MARSRRTPAMFVGGCSWELSGRKLHRKIKKSQTLSEALRRSIANRGLYGAESKDPGVFKLPMPFEHFQPLKPAPGGPATIFPWGRHPLVEITFPKRPKSKTRSKADASFPSRPPASPALLDSNAHTRFPIAHAWPPSQKTGCANKAWK